MSRSAVPVPVAPEISAETAQLELLYRQYAPALRALCRRRLGDHALAEDACHETFLRAATALHRLRPDAPAWPWLARIAQRVCVDLHRQRARWVPVERVPERPCPPDGDTVRTLCQRQILAEGLRRLPAASRRFVYLRHVEGWRYRELAKSGHMSAAAVRSVLFHARRRLRSHVIAAARRRGLWPLPALFPLAGVRARMARLRDVVLRLPPSSPCALAHPALAATVAPGAMASAAAILVLLGPGGAGPPASPPTFSETVAVDGTAVAARAHPMVEETPGVGPRGALSDQASAEATPVAAPEPVGTPPATQVASVDVSPAVRREVAEDGGTNYVAEPAGGSADVDGDGEESDDLRREAKTVLSCPPPGEQGAVDGLACAAAESVLGLAPS